MARSAINGRRAAQIKSCQSHANRALSCYEILTETGPPSQNPSCRGFVGKLRLRRLRTTQSAPPGTEGGRSEYGASQAWHQLSSQVAGQNNGEASSQASGKNHSQAGGQAGCDGT
jgi:hypothetical protein